MRKLLLGLLFFPIVSFSAQEPSKEQVFAMAKETVMEYVQKGVIVDESELFLKAIVTSYGLPFYCDGQAFQDMTPKSCLQQTCPDGYCPMAGEAQIARFIGQAVGSYLVGRYTGKIVDPVMDRFEKRLSDWHERTQREIRERVAAERRERDEHERCAFGAGPLVHGCN